VTNKEKQLVTENHNLIYSFCHRHNLDIEDWYGIIAYKLCQAVQTHDVKKGALTTYFYTLAYNEMITTFNKNKIDATHKKAFPIDESWDITILKDNCDPKVIANELLEKIEKLENKDILLLSLEGFTQVEIAEKLGVSRKTINQKLQIAKKELLDWYEKE